MKAGGGGGRRTAEGGAGDTERRRDRLFARASKAFRDRVCGRLGGWLVELVAGEVAYVKDVDRAFGVGGDARMVNIHAHRVERAGDAIQQADLVGRAHLN